MAQTILVTGSAGFIGFHLCRRLLETTDANVVGFDNVNDYYDVTLKESRLSILSAFDRFTFVRGDLADNDAVVALFDRFAFTIVVHLAAQAGVRYSIVNPRAYIESNIVGFFNVLEAVRAHPVEHLLYASSSSIYGNQQKTPFSLDDRVDEPISLYAATKKSDELIAHAYAHLFGIPATGLRFFTVYGPFGRPDMAYFKFANKIYAGEPIDVYNHGDLLRDFTYIDDIVNALTVMLARPPAPDASGKRYALYNLGNSTPVPLMRFIEVLQDALGKKAVLRYLPMQQGDVYQTYADISAAERDFGFSPATAITEGLPAFAKWYRAYYHKKRL